MKKFRTWAERRQFNREMKRKQAESERPILPANQKLITLSVQDAPTKKGELGLINCNVDRLLILLSFFMLFFYTAIFYLMFFKCILCV